MDGGPVLLLKSLHFHSQVANQSREFCVLVHLFPKVLYHSEEEVYHQMEKGQSKNKREMTTAITRATLIGLGLAGISTGILILAL